MDEANGDVPQCPTALSEVGVASNFEHCSKMSPCFQTIGGKSCQPTVDKSVGALENCEAQMYPNVSFRTPSIPLVFACMTNHGCIQGQIQPNTIDPGAQLMLGSWQTLNTEKYLGSTGIFVIAIQVENIRI